MNTLRVNLAENSYNILVGSGQLSSLGLHCKTLGVGQHAAVITNTTVAPLYGEAVESSLLSAGFKVSRIVIPDGEEYKNAATLSMVYDRLIETGIDRTSFIVALGGGVVGDLAGFAAATYLRGVPFVQVPTTLLAQVDSSVGGKTAIDHPRGKNLIGAFYQPRLVLIDCGTLSTLDSRQFRAGLAEVVKYGVVLDKEFFCYLEDHVEAVLALDPGVLKHVICRSCTIKAGVVEQDERETGLRAVLNYGHTLGHAFETLAGYQSLVHGEAVAIGMALAARVSQVLGTASVQDETRIRSLLARFGLSLEIPDGYRDQLADVLAHDKKSRDGAIGFVCNQGIGHYEMARFLPSELLKICGLEV